MAHTHHCDICKTPTDVNDLGEFSTTVTPELPFYIKEVCFRCRKSLVKVIIVELKSLSKPRATVTAPISPQRALQ